MSSIPPTINSSVNLGTQAEAAIRKLRERLLATRRILINQRIGIALCAIFAVGALGVAISAAIDWYVELPVTSRASWIGLLFLAGLVTASVCWRRWIATYTLSDAAADAECQLIQFGQRLRTTLDYQQQVPPPAAASASLLDSLNNETWKLAEQTEWNEAVDSRPLLRSMAMFAVVVVAWLVALFMIPEFRVAAARAVLIPIEYTTVTYTPITSTVRPGEAVTVTAIVTGRPISSAQLRYRPTGTESKWETIDLVSPEQEQAASERGEKAPVLLHGDLIAKLTDLQQDLEFEVVAGPRSLPTGSIRVLQPLTLVKSEAKITPPSYTGRPIETVTALNLKVLEGSTVELKFEFNRPAAEAKLVRLCADPRRAESAEIPLAVQDQVVHGTLSNRRQNAASYVLSARAADGMELDPVSVIVRVQLDRKPEVTFIEPPEELVVTPTTEVPVIVEADDDIGLHKVGVMYQIGNGPMQTLIEQDADGSTDPYRMLSAMLLEEHHLTHQDAVTYYAFAEDNYFGQPRRTTTPLRFIDIRPYKLAFQVIDKDGGACKGSVTLEELITRQRQGLSQVFDANQQSVSKESAAHLSEVQEELLDATVEFSQGLAELGMKVPTLDEAIRHMENSIEALDKVDLPNAVPAEQEALAALIRARENLRKQLNQGSSQASNCRKFDRQQRQKLRLPEKKKADQQQQLAQARQKLEDIAKRERQWSQQAQQCCNSSSSSSSASKPSSKSSQQQQSQSQQQQDANQSSEPEGDKSESPSPAQVAAAQEKMQAELAELQQQLDKLNNGQAARNQARQAAESMQQGLNELKKEDGNAAAREGERSAEQLEQLSAHLAAMNARDFGQRLDQAQKMTQQLAGRQGSLEKQMRDSMGASKGDSNSKTGSESQSETNGQKPGGESGQSGAGDKPGAGKDSQQLARDQQALAAQTELLADLLDNIAKDASRESAGVRQKLEQAQGENPPREIAAGMQQTAEELQAQRTATASRGATQAREQLQELSKSLGTVRGEYAQPQLKELMALEEQFAQLQQLRRGQVNSDRASAEQKWQQVEPRLDRMAAADRRLADAMKQLREGSTSKNAGTKPSDQTGSKIGGNAPPKSNTQLVGAPNVDSTSQSTPEGFYSWLELSDQNGMREVSKVLQTKIQEAILAGALMDADQPVPPAYEELVEKYYRALSDDLR